MAYVLLTSLIFLSLLGLGPPVGGAGAAGVPSESKALIRAPSANTHSSSHLGSSSHHPSTDLEPLHLNHAQTPNQRFPPPPVSLPSPTSSYDLLDTILVASIDGKFHALNRTSGQTLWSMAGFAETTSVSAPAELGPLVGTVHSGGRGRINGGKGSRRGSSAGRGDGEEGGDDGYGEEEEEEEEDAETYIIEPQSGDIYVLTSPSSALQRFPFSMAQLVDISPFTSTVSGDDVGSAGKGKGKGENTRVFVGRKETSLLVIELETGRVKATLNAECPFVPEPEEDEDGEDSAWEDEDVDEGQGRKRRGMISAPTEVYIGRTDYHISILKKPTPSNPSPPTQELRFSTYGPNNRDNHLQAMYRRTRDDVYVQSLPNGDVIAFKTGAGEGEGGEGGAGKEGGNGAGGGAMWGKAFPSTIVAIFDVLKPPHPSTSAPFVLLQPRPSLADLFPHASSNDLFPFGPGNTNTNNGGSASGSAGTGTGTTAYIGIVEGAGTESLYVLSPERYPLVVFGSGDGSGKGRRARIEGPKSTTTTSTSESGTTTPSTSSPKSQDALEHETEDGYTKPRYQDSHAQDPSSSFDDLDQCLLRPSAPRCLVGIHALMPEGNGDVESVYGRWKRLIDGPSVPGGGGGGGVYNGPGGGGQQAMDNGSGSGVGVGMNGSEEKKAEVIVSAPRPGGDGDNTSAEGAQTPFDTPRTWPPVPYIGDGALPSVGGGRLGGIAAGDWELLSALVMFLVGAVVLGGRVRSWLGAARGRGVGVGLKDAKGVEGVKELEMEVGRGLRKDKELPEVPGLEEEKEKERGEGERAVADVMQFARPSASNVPSPGTATDADAEVVVTANGDAVKDVMEKKIQAMEKEATEKQQAIENEEEDGILVPRPSTPLSPSAHPLVPQTPLTPSTPRALGASNSNGPNGNFSSRTISSTSANAIVDADDDGEESDADGAGAGAGTNGVGAAGGAAGKKKSRRGKRGKKKKGGVGLEVDVEQKDSKDSVKDKDSKDSIKEKEKEEEKKPSSIVLTTSSPKPVVVQPSLYVSDTILGFGSHGTVVYQGSLQGRAVAVKRLLQDFVTLAAREVSILQESDDHPNVIRYYYQESHANFLYIALELCPASLADIIEAPDRDQWREISVNFEPKRALRQIGSGMRHLHALGLVHRDIKPQNILVGIAPGASTAGGGGGKGKAYRMLISDFGLCKKLDVDQTSFLPTAYGAAGAGTVGWRAPEILRGEVRLDWANGDESLSSRGSVATVHNSSTGSSGSGANGTGNRTRLTKSVDIFALGCLFYYTLTSGGHPYGDRFEREVNIMRDAKELGALERFGEEGTEARDLIRRMLSFEARDRPDTTSILLHPFFWDPGRRLNFLQDASDRFEIMCREPRDPHLLALEKGAFGVVGNDWQARLDRVFIENLGKFRKYDGKSVQDLMRALRNKKHHYQDLPDNVKRHLGPMPEGYLAYFTRRYPDLFLHVHAVVKDTGLSKESMFRAYFELPDM